MSVYIKLSLLQSLHVDTLVTGMTQIARKYSTAMCQLLVVGVENFSGAHTFFAYQLLSAHRPNSVSDVCNVCRAYFWNEMELLKCCTLSKLLRRVLNQQQQEATVSFLAFLEADYKIATEFRNSTSRCLLRACVHLGQDPQSVLPRISEDKQSIHVKCEESRH